LTISATLLTISATLLTISATLLTISATLLTISDNYNVPRTAAWKQDLSLLWQLIERRPEYLHQMHAACTLNNLSVEKSESY
ncbi:hypothetical protein, partial [[Eubacterium] cellulosolvens]